MSRTSNRKGPTELELEVGRLNDEGLGVAIHNDREVHIRNALEGETVQARILKKRKGIRFADGVEVLASEHRLRVPAPCAYFPRCGGCSLQHMTYSFQLEHKANQVKTELNKVGIEPVTWKPPTSAGELGYRRKARLGVRVVGEHILVGFRESFSNRVSRMDVCSTLTPSLSELIQPLKKAIALQSQPQTIPQIELAAGDDEQVVIVRHLEALTDQDQDVWRNFALDSDAIVLLQPKGYETVHTLDETPVPQLKYKVRNAEMLFDPRQFTQVNASMNDVLVGQALSYLTPLDNKRVLDLFCGIGNFSIPIAIQGAQVVGVEFADEAVQQARLNAAKNRVPESLFLGMNLYEVSEFLDVATETDVMVLDPPRSGAGPLLGHWLEHLTALEEIVYVSCKPKTFAEDVKVMAQYGFQLHEVGAYDMFPQTAHVETIGYLKRG